MKKKWTHIKTDQTQVEHLHEQLKVDRMVSQLLVQRGITTFEQAKKFFRPTLDELHDPFLMKDMDKAVSRLVEAINNNERILLYGDYDVDGTTCVSMMFTFLSRIGKLDNIDYYIPNRYREGYGISLKGISYAAETDTSLMIAMDCGIQARNQIDKANTLGIDTIICDHHLPGEQLPKAKAVLDPKRKDCDYPYKELSGCGVTFKLVQAVAAELGYSEEVWLDLLDLLVISIGCDIVQMTGENRILAHYGLQQINQGNARIGIRSLIEKSGKEYPVTISDLVFGAGPMINAAGRLDDAKEAVRLLLSDNESEANVMAESLKSKNVNRREQDRSITKEACEIIDAWEDLDDRKTIVLGQSHWHKGVVGISASKLVEKYHRPTIILTKNNDLWVGSARSVPGFDIHSAISACKEYLNNFGGHQFAAGLSLESSNLENFRKAFEKQVANTITEEELTPEIMVSGELDFKGITPRFWKILRQFAPFGPGNHKPVFTTRNVKDTGDSRIVKDEHLKLRVSQDDGKVIGGIGFWMADAYEDISNGTFDLCYTIQPNTWRGKTALDLQVRDIK